MSTTSLRRITLAATWALLAACGGGGGGAPPPPPPPPPSPPVLTVTLQPAATSAVAGTPASFSVAATCSTLALGIQWQRGQTAGGVLTWVDVTAATAATHTFATGIGDNGLQFRARLDCGGLAATTSQPATLVVTPPPTVTMEALPLVGLRPQAEILEVAGIDRHPDGSYRFISSNRIQRLSADLSSITPVAGALGVGATDGAADAALFRQPLGLAHDAAGNTYVADTANHTIRRIAPDGTVSTLAGSAGIAGTADGSGATARFSRTAAIAMGPDGDLYVADQDNARIRRVTTAGVVSTYAGSVFGVADGPALTARFVAPSGLAIAANGDVLVADGLRIRRILRSGNSAGSVQTVAGSSASSPPNDGVGAAAVVSPGAMVVRGNTLTFRDHNGLLRQLDLASTAVTTLAGSRALGAGFADGVAPDARVYGTGGLALADDGGFMLAEYRSLRQASATGVLHTFASGFAQGMRASGTGTLSQMPFASLASSGGLQAVTVDPAGNVVVFEKITRLVRRIAPSGSVTLAAGLTTGSAPAPVTDGIGSAAQFNSGFAALASDSAGVLYLGDDFGMRRIAPDNSVTLLAGSRTDAGAVDGPAATARFQTIRGVAVRPGGDVFVADSGNAIRRIDAAGNVSTYAGVMGQGGSTDGPVAAARFTLPGPMAFAPDGSLFVVDQIAGNGVIRRIAPDGASVSTLALAADSQVTALAVDATGTLYYAGYPGLMRLPPGGTPSVLVPRGAGVVLGANPSVWDVDGIAVLAPGQLVVLSGGQILRVTLP